MKSTNNQQSKLERKAWLFLYIYSIQLVACTSGPQGVVPASSAPAAIATARVALATDFESTYTLSTPVSDGSAPTGGGDLRGQTPFSYSVSPDGEFQAEIPINVPPGRNGVEPHIALSYGHRRGADIAGLGWSLRGLSRLTRCSKTRAMDQQRRSVESSMTV